MRSKKYCEQMTSLVNATGLKVKPVKLLTEGQLLKAVTEMKKVNGHALSPVTVNRYLSYLKVLMNYGVQRGCLEKNPLASWRKVKEQPREMHITEDDLRLIYENAAPHLKWIITCMTNLGCRPGPSELFSITWADFDWEGLQVRVQCGKTRGEKRWVPITEHFAQLCQEQQKGAKTAYLCEYRGEPIIKIRRAFTTALKKANVTYRASLYDLRHLYATTLLRKGADIKSVSEILGHKNTQMTLNVYHHAMPEEKRRAVQFVPSVG